MYVVAYDITDNKERKKVSEFLDNFGERIQKSVYVCELDSMDSLRMRRGLENLNITTGNVHIWIAHSNPWRIGAEETMSERSWSHCM